jgi:hypothetical protein
MIDIELFWDLQKNILPESGKISRHGNLNFPLKVKRGETRMKRLPVNLGKDLYLTNLCFRIINVLC